MSDEDRELWWWNDDEITDDDKDLFFFSDWFQNGTFNYDEYQADVDRVDSNIHGYSDIAFSTFLTSTAFNVLIFVVFMVMYEVLRRCFPNVYASRQIKEARIIAAKKQAKENKISDGIEDNKTVESKVLFPALKKRRYSTIKKLPNMQKAERPLAWVGQVFGVSWRQVREAVGLDAYFYLRYIRMCLKITSVGALWGVIILFPVYAAGQNDAVGWYHVSLANVTQGSSIIWVSVVYMYFFTLFVLYVMKQEYKHFVDLRLDFLGKGDDLTEPQHKYSVLVENIPKELRSDQNLYNYFDKLFPGKVHSASVVLKVPVLEALSNEKLDVTRALEKSIACYEATRKRPTHITGRPRTVIDGIEMTPVDLWFDSDEVIDLDTHYRAHDSVHVESGVRVDSIDFYSRSLQKINNKMILLQKERAEQANLGDRSFRGFDKWFHTLSVYVDKVFYDLDNDSKDEGDSDDEISYALSFDSWTSSVDVSVNSFEASVSLLETSKMDSAAWHHPSTKKNLMMSVKNDSSTTNLSSVVKFAEDIDGSGGKKDSPKKNVVSGEKGTNFTKFFGKQHSKPRIIMTSEDSMSTISGGTYGSDGIALPNVMSDDTKKIFNKSNQTKSSRSLKIKQEPLLKNAQHYSMSSAISREAQEQGGSCMNDLRSRASCLTSVSTRRVSKFAGRMGFDFGAYLVKFVTRKLQSFRDDEKKDVMASTGFVTFLDLATVTCVASAPLTHKPKTLDVTVAPERRDILWENCSRRADVNEGREFNANMYLVLGAALWSVPLAGIQIFASADMLSRLPGLGFIADDDNENLRVLINSYLPVVALLTFILILPYVFQAVAMYYEHRKTLSDVNRTTVSRYFYYQLANIYISVTAGSIWISATQIIARPSAALEILGNTLPAVVGYFITLIVTKMLAGLPIIILRPYALFRYLFLRLIQSKKYMTQRELENVYCLEPVYYSWEYPSQMLVIVICFTYASISPIILIFGAMYFFAALMVYKKQVLYVYTPFYESGGDLFPLVCDRTITGLICGQLTFMGYSVVRGGHFLQVLSAIPLIMFTFWTTLYFRHHYELPSKRLTLELAMEIDDKIKERAENRGKKHRGPENSIPQDSFDPNYYKQPVMTEPDGEPLFYRIERQDSMTKKVRENLKRKQLHVWEHKRKKVFDEDSLQDTKTTLQADASLMT